MNPLAGRRWAGKATNIVSREEFSGSATDQGQDLQLQGPGHGIDLKWTRGLEK